MPEPVLYSLEAEEALLTALLLWDDSASLAYFTDDDVWYDHLRPVFGMIRARHARAEPYGLIFLLFDLQPQLDALAWRGLRGEALLVDLLERHRGDVWSYYGPGAANVVHHYAERRRNLGEAQNAAALAYTQWMGSSERESNPREKYEGEL